MTGLTLALLSALLVSVQAVQAAREDRPAPMREDRPAAAREDRPGTMRQERPAAAREDRPGTMRQERPAAAREDRPGREPRPDRAVDQQREYRDRRYHHDRVYPARGYVVRALPRDHRVVVHSGARFYFHGGVWYRPHGPRFTIVAPPIGLFVPFLPPYYATIWVGGSPFYYANEVYYAHRGNGYVVVEPPSEPVSQAPPPADQLFIYPRHSQNDAQQATDRYECHSWAVSQTGFDPTRFDAPDAGRGEKRADYQRAMSACLDGRGYTVR